MLPRTLKEQTELMIRLCLWLVAFAQKWLNSPSCCGRGRQLWVSTSPASRYSAWAEAQRIKVQYHEHWACDGQQHHQVDRTIKTRVCRGFCLRIGFYFLRWTGKIWFVYFRNQAAFIGLRKNSETWPSGQRPVCVWVCFTMVLVHCVPFQCICRGPDSDRENQEVRFDIAGWLTSLEQRFPNE